MVSPRLANCGWGNANGTEVGVVGGAAVGGGHLFEAKKQKMPTKASKVDGSSLRYQC
jgi:hypothetical protein